MMGSPEFETMGVFGLRAVRFVIAWAIGMLLLVNVCNEIDGVIV